MSADDPTLGAFDTSVGATTTMERPTDPAVDGDGYTEGLDEMGSAARALPGEDAPLPRRRGGPPVTPEEALGTARRMLKERARRRGEPEPELPEALPFLEESGVSPILSIRSPRRIWWIGHAKADMEGRGLSDAMREALGAYGASPPGSTVLYVPPGFRAVLVPEDEAAPES